MIIVGERINGTSRKVREAVVGRGYGLHRLPRASGRPRPAPTYLDVNAGTDPEREPDDMVWLVQTVQGATGGASAASIRRMSEALRARAWRRTRGRRLVNSASAESSRMQSGDRARREARGPAGGAHPG